MSASCIRKRASNGVYDGENMLSWRAYDIGFCNS